MWRTLLVFFGVFGAAGMIAAAPRESPSQSVEDVPVAILFNHSIFIHGLQPSEIEIHRAKQHLTEERFNEWREEVLYGKLEARIFESIERQFCKEHSCEPTEEEIATFQRSKAGSSQGQRWKAEEVTVLKQQLNDPTISPALREQLTKFSEHTEQIAKGSMGAASFIRRWKFNKAMYEQYGGAVDVGGPKTALVSSPAISPVGAYRVYLREQEQKGSFKITDPVFRAKFWEHFDKPQPFEIKKVDKNPFQIPWWESQ